MPVGIDQPSIIDHDPISAFLEHATERSRNGSLIWSEVCIDIEDERRVVITRQDGRSIGSCHQPEVVMLKSLDDDGSITDDFPVENDEGAFS